MALTQVQKYRVLRYLGWPLKTIDSTSTTYSNIVAARLSGFPVDAEGMLVELLDRIESIDETLAQMIARSNVKSVDDIEFFEDGTYDLRRERGKVIREISIMVDIAVIGNCGAMVNIGV